MQLDSDQRLANQEPADHPLPLVIDQNLVHLFTYWNENTQQGMRYGKELYAFQQSFPLNQRLQAYVTGCEYAEQGSKVCITVSKQGYTIWLNLRSLNSLPTIPSQTLKN
ncbi:MAG TPA: hypothetical protein V6C78_33080 [Crinalium sp.]|jgi:hypothetical protein